MKRTPEYQNARLKKSARLTALAVVVIGLCLNVGQARAQVSVRDWSIFSSLLTTRAADRSDDGTLWVASSGGVFSVASDGQIGEYRSIGALLGSDITTLAIDRTRDRVYVGSFEGVIDIFDGQTWTHVTDIANQANLTRKRINAIRFAGDRVFVAGDFGILIYDTLNIPGDYIERLGSFTAGTVVRDVIIRGDTIWAVTSSGLAKASLNAQTLRNPDAWTNHFPTDGLLDADARSATVLNDSLFVVSARGIWAYAQGNVVRVSDSANVRELNSITAFNGQLVLTSPGRIFYYAGSDLPVVNPGFLNGAALAGQELVIFYQLAGIGVFDGNQMRLIQPNSPLSNFNISVATGPNGSIWTTTDFLLRQGFSVLSNGTWYRYLAGSNPAVVNNFAHITSTLPNGDVWVSTYGGGAIRGRIGENGVPELTLFNENNSALRGSAGAGEAFIVAGRAKADRNNNVWIPNYGDQIKPGPAIVVIRPDGTSQGFTNPLSTLQRSHLALEIDISGTKWMGSRDELGLTWFNERNTPDNLSDDSWGWLTVSNSNLPGATVSSLAIDKTGILWVGTASGLGVIFNPGSVLSRSTLPSIQRVQALTGQAINAILVDAVNNKWLGTNNGIFVLNPDGSEVLAQYNTSNSPLPTNLIRSLATNEETGQVYVGTDAGLFVATTLALKPGSAYNVVCYPQPFNPASDPELIIDGLTEGSRIYITTPSGMPVRTLQTNSRRTLWDGNTDQGTPAPSGVYLVLLKSSELEASAVAKIAIERR